MPLPPRRTPLLRTVLATSALLVLALVLVLVFLRVDRVVVASGELVGGSRIVRSPLDARIAEVLVRADQEIRAGEPLIVLESEALHNERRRTEARIEALESRLAALEAQRRHEDGVRHPRTRREAELALERARLEEEVATRQLASLEALVADGLVDRITVDEARLRRDVAEVAREEAQLTAETLGAEQDAALEALDAELRQARSTLEEQRLAAAELARREALSTLVAPIDGKVLGSQLEHLAGRRVLAGDELLAIAGGRAERFVGVLSESERPRVRRSLPVRLRVEGYPWLLHGSVRGRVSALADSAADGAYPVEVALEGGSGLELFEGMHADARILVEERVRIGELLFERLVEQ